MTNSNDPRRPEDAAWIREVLERHERSLILYASRMLGDVERARDCVQEAFLRLCNQSREEVEGGVEVWLFTVVRNLCHDVFRKESRMTELEDERADRTAGSAPTPEELAEVKDSHSRVLESMTSLPPKQREVLQLKFQHGLSYKEISRITQESVGNVGWLLHTGLKTLRGRLATSEIQGAEA